MTKSEAKFLLQGSRPGETGPEPSALRKALEMAANDPELHQWYEQDQAFDQAFQEKLHEIQPPEGLRDAILDQQVSSESQKNGTPHLTLIPGRRFLTMAAAATVIFMFGFSLPWVFKGNDVPNNPASPVPEYLAHLSENVLNRPKALQHRGASLDEMRTFLVSSNVATPSNPPASLQEMQPVGCMVLEWNGVEMSMLCFSEGDTVFHLFSANLSCYPDLFPNFDATLLPADFRVGETAFRVWKDESQVSILTYEGPHQELTRFF